MCVYVCNQISLVISIYLHTIGCIKFLQCVTV